MIEKEHPTGWREGDTAEDFARLVHAGLGDRTAGVVGVPCEDFTLPDNVVLGGHLEGNNPDICVTYVELLSGALRDLQGIEAKAFRAVPSSGVEPWRPFSMSLAVTATRLPKVPELN